jgi:hypothetical protein
VFSKINKQGIYMHTFKATHGVSVTPSATPTDCVSRKVIVFYSEGSDNYYVQIETQWTTDTKPVITELQLSPDGVQLLSNALILMLNSRESYRYNT